MAPRISESTRRTMGLSAGSVLQVHVALARRRRPRAARAATRRRARAAGRPPRCRFRTCRHPRRGGATTASMGRPRWNSTSSTSRTLSRAPKASTSRPPSRRDGHAAVADHQLERHLRPQGGIVGERIERLEGEAAARRSTQQAPVGHGRSRDGGGPLGICRGTRSTRICCRAGGHSWDSTTPSTDELARGWRDSVDEGERLHRLFAADWDYTMREYPEAATWFGYPGHHHRWTDLSLEAIDRRNRGAGEPGPRAGHPSTARGCPPADQVHHDLFARGVEEAPARAGASAPS